MIAIAASRLDTVTFDITARRLHVQWADDAINRPFWVSCKLFMKYMGYVALRDVIALFELVNAREWHYIWPGYRFGLTKI